MERVISADEIKKTLPNYSPERAEEFHHESARLADKLFAHQLRQNPTNEVILLNGGTASGKTEFLKAYLLRKYPTAIIFDATLSTLAGLEIKLRMIARAQKIPIIFAIIPDNLNRAFFTFLHRDRKFSDRHFYRTHSGARETLLKIVFNYPQVEVHIIESSYAKDQQIGFTELSFSSQTDLRTYVQKVQLSETEIVALLFPLGNPKISP